MNWTASCRWPRPRPSSRSPPRPLAPRPSAGPAVLVAVRLTGEEPTINRNLDDVQWVQRFGAEPNAVYVFGRIDQSTVGLTSRLELAFTPTLSLQLYAQPFLSAGSYRDFRRVTDPKAEEYAESGDFRLGSNMSDLFATESRNVLMVSDPQAPPSVPLELPSSFHML